MYACSSGSENRWRGTRSFFCQSRSLGSMWALNVS
jgi:hypothetical protein